MEERAKVAAIFVYPIKSCRGISLPRASLTPTGFRWDRNWLVVNEKGRFCTQRVDPKLALVRVDMPEGAFMEDWKPTRDSVMTISAPGMGLLKIPLTEPNQLVDGVSVWDWTGSAFYEGPEAAKWFSDYLGKACRLVRHNAASERHTNPNNAPGHKIAFSDKFPLMLISQPSMDEVNKLLPEPLPYHHFRPVIRVDGCEPFAEDLWKEIKINDCTLEDAALVPRCKMTAINQETGEEGIAPVECLKNHRSDKILFPDKESKGSVYLGLYLVWKDYTSTRKGKFISVGDPVFVVSKYSSVTEAKLEVKGSVAEAKIEVKG